MRPFTAPPTPAARYTEPPRPACADQEDDDLWHPDYSDAARAAATAQRLYCGTCPARDACLTEALANDVQGTWAGTSWRQRDAMRAKAGRVALSLGTREASGVERR